MKKTVQMAVAAIAILLASAAISTAPAVAKVAIVQASTPMLAASSSFAWAPVNSAVVDRPDPALANTIATERLRIAVDTALGSHGYVKTTTTANSDLVVSFHVVLEGRQDVTVSRNGGLVCGWRGCLRRWPTTATVSRDDYTQGILVLDLVDRRTGALVWRGRSERRINTKDVSQAKLNSLVASMMKSLPYI